MEALSEVVGRVMAGDVCDCTKACVVPEPEVFPVAAVKLIIVSGIHQNTSVCMQLHNTLRNTQSHFVISAQKQEFGEMTVTSYLNPDLIHFKPAVGTIAII